MASRHQVSQRRSADDPATLQGKLLQFLLNPHSYPHQPKRVRLIQTHSALVFVALPFVYKIKKAVNFGFLDFSTLEKRRAVCDRELVLNRRLSHGVYLDVVPVCSDDGRLTFGGGGRVVEYAIKMKHLSESRMLDRLVRAGRVANRDLRRIAEALGRFYRAQHPTPEVEAWGRPVRLKVSTNENFEQTRDFLGRTLSRPTFEAVRVYTRRFFKTGAKLLARRVKEKRIRDCHGDLHLEHIHLTSRTLQIYDCIEFNDRFRYVDVANDIAFLAMDLDHEGRADLSRTLVRQMVVELQDVELSQLMPFYKCYRAYVRGKVESLHSVASTAPPEERVASAERASGYFRLALNYAIGASEPMVLAVIGRIGSGKSSIARGLGAELGWRVISSDAVRKGMAGFPLSVRTDEQARKVLYADRMTQRTYRALLEGALSAAKQGESTILDATFARKSQRLWLRKALESKGIQLRFVELKATDQEVRRRLRQRARRPTEISDARLEDFEKLSGIYEPAAELPSHLVVRIGSNGTLSQVTTSTLNALARLAADSQAGPKEQVRQAIHETGPA